METSSTYEGKVYVIRVKPSRVKNWEHEDIIYGVAYEGSSNFSFNDFKSLCQDYNEKWFVSKKANKNTDESCSWGEIVSCMRSAVPRGTPLISLTEKARTWVEIGVMAYEKGFFTNAEGKKWISEFAKATPGSPQITGPSPSVKSLAETARKNAEEFAKSKENIDTAGLSQAEKILMGCFNPESEYSLENKTHSELLTMIRDCHAIILSKDHKIDQLETDLLDSKNQIDDLKKEKEDIHAKLEDAMAGNSGFMIAADKANLEMKRLNDIFAAEVVKGLKPFITSQIATIQTNIKPVLEVADPVKRILETTENNSNKLDRINNTVEKFSEDFQKGFNTITDVSDTNLESTIEYIGEMKDKLNEMNHNIAAMRNNDTTKVNNKIKHAGLCSFQTTDDHPSTYTCTLGCGAVLQCTVPDAAPSTAPPKPQPSSQPLPFAPHPNSTAPAYPDSVSAPGNQFYQGPDLTYQESGNNNNKYPKKRKQQDNNYEFKQNNMQYQNMDNNYEFKQKNMQYQNTRYQQRQFKQQKQQQPPQYHFNPNYPPPRQQPYTNQATQHVQLQNSHFQQSYQAPP